VDLYTPPLLIFLDTLHATVQIFKPGSLNSIFQVTTPPPPQMWKFLNRFEILSHFQNVILNMSKWLQININWTNSKGAVKRDALKRLSQPLGLTKLPHRNRVHLTWRGVSDTGHTFTMGPCRWGRADETDGNGNGPCSFRASTPVTGHSSPPLSPLCTSTQCVILFYSSWAALRCTQNYGIPRLWPSFGFVNTRDHNVLETGSVFILRYGEGDTYSVGSLRKS
jgi:hypothetical protein